VSIRISPPFRVPWSREFLLRCCSGVLLAALTPLSAFAGLGGDLNSILTDQVHFQGNVQMTQMASYTVHEIRPAAGIKGGTVIREYVSPAGKIFAVSWHGAWPPDMRQLLGSYFPQYHDAIQAEANAHPGRRTVQIVQPEFVFQQGGHPRSFTGRAYLPQMLPAGMKAEEIQ
jgi:hypothetical protein